MPASAYAAAVVWPPRRATGRGREPAADHRVWVGAQWYATAEDVLRNELPRVTAAHDEAERLAAGRPEPGTDPE
jgi:hypothetical protein